jgi:hypothetical protein
MYRFFRCGEYLINPDHIMAVHFKNGTAHVQLTAGNCTFPEAEFIKAYEGTLGPATYGLGVPGTPANQNLQLVSDWSGQCDNGLAAATFGAIDPARYQIGRQNPFIAQNPEVKANEGQ